MRQKGRVDVSVYGVAGPPDTLGRPLEEVVEAALAGGMTIFQLRDKHSDTRPMVDQARRLAAICRQRRATFVVNDRVDVAMAAGADGVHLGQQDMAVEDARRLLGDDAIVGLTIHSEAEAQSAPVELVDYFGVGGVYPTRSKDNPDPPIGPHGLARIVRILNGRAPSAPVVAIAGITADTVPEVIAAGADGVAVVSAIFGATDVEAAARTLAERVSGSRRSRS